VSSAAGGVDAGADVSGGVDAGAGVDAGGVDAGAGVDAAGELADGLVLFAGDPPQANSDATSTNAIRIANTFFILSPPFFNIWIGIVFILTQKNGTVNYHK